MLKESQTILGMCTGNFQENDERPQPGTKCFGSCIERSGYWGSIRIFLQLLEYPRIMDQILNTQSM